MECASIFQKPELLAPAGSYETFLAVLNAGADAVYLGGSLFGARAYANNFSEEELLKAIDYAHIHGKKLYLTINTLLKEQELEKQLSHFLLPFYRQGLDAVIVQDFGALHFIRKEFPELAIHASTQMTIANRYGAERMRELGVARIVTARELSFVEIEDIAEHVDIEIEVFVHGALCYCYSGQCLLSSMLGGRSGNRGRCAQPCRLPYEVYDASHRRICAAGPFVLSPKDLCTIEYLPKLMESGIHSFKIEGRMKQAEYAAGVVSIYRNYIDCCMENRGKAYKVSEADRKKLQDLGNRSGFTDGYCIRHNGKSMITFQKPGHTSGNKALQQEIQKRYIGIEKKERISGKLRLKIDLPAKMELYFKDICVTAEGDIVQSARNQPISLEKVEENIKKTGNTPFVFEKLDILMDEGIFLPVRSLNQLRRDALKALEEKVLVPFKRQKNLYHSEEKEISGTDFIRGKETLAASVESREQLGAVLLYEEITEVYIDQSCYSRKNLKEALQEDILAAKGKGKKVYYIFPSVFRKAASDFYLKELEFFGRLQLDGVVVKSYDALGFVKKRMPGMEFLADQSLYNFNNRAADALRREQPVRITAPYELNWQELRIQKNRNREILLYGYLPLMISAQCIHANTGVCDKMSGLLYLKDRYGKFFPVKNHCMECYNTIYNSTPLLLFDYKNELERIGFSSFRLSFTIETKEQVKEVMRLYRNMSVGGSVLKDIYSGERTSGHLKRGVE